MVSRHVFNNGKIASMHGTPQPPYLQRIESLKARLEQMQSPARLDLPFTPGRPPTQAYSEFLTNKEQGDWAEQTFIENFNRLDNGMWAVKYGRSEDLVAGEPGFDDYYVSYQQELAEIGKRPDVLIFPCDAFTPLLGASTDISCLPIQQLDSLVPQALAAIEVRSSAFVSLKYKAASEAKRLQSEQAIQLAARTLCNHYANELRQFSPVWLAFAQAASTGQRPLPDTPRVLSRRSTERLQQASALTRQIKDCLKQLDKRSFLSITPKSEDLSLVYRWLQRYAVPHHYCQVFFDRAVLISFERILELIADPTRENKDFFIEADEKNQGKVTFKINADLGTELMADIGLPLHRSAMKELPQGRLLFYVRFEPSSARFVNTTSLHG